MPFLCCKTVSFLCDLTGTSTVVQIDVKSLEIKSIIYYFFKKVETQFQCTKNIDMNIGCFESCLNFPGTAILNFYNVTWLLHCCIQKKR